MSVYFLRVKFQVSSITLTSFRQGIILPLGRPFQTIGRAFVTLRENQKLGRKFENLIRVFVLQHGPCRHNQPQ